VRNGRLWLVGVIALFVGFWLLRGVLSSLDGSPSESGEPARRSVPAAEEVEAQELVVELVEPQRRRRTPSSHAPSTTSLRSAGLGEARQR